MELRFREGTHVYTADGEEIGTVDRIILDPTTNKVAGIVIQQGWLFTEDKVVSIDLIANATEDRVTLHHTEYNLGNLPKFEERYYVPLNHDDWAEGEEPAYPLADGYTHPAPMYGYAPVGTAWWGYGGYFGLPPAGAAPDVVERTKQNIPEGTVAVKKGAKVLSASGKHVGDVEEVFIDEATNRATHIVITQGLLFKERKLIPTNWVRNAGEDEVSLTVNTGVVNRLPDYEPAR